MADQIFYQGPDKEFTPDEGANRESRTGPEPGGIKTGYADVSYLLRLLALLRAETNASISLMENELNQLVLSVKADDSQLREALLEEWPSARGPMRDFIPFPYYRALEARDTASATYIRKRWEAGAREIGGPTTFDLIQPLYVIRNEVELVADFVTKFIGSVNDSSEERTLELLQEWAAIALASTRNIGKLYRAQGEEKGFSAADLDSLSAQESAQYQAIFKVKVNEANLELEKQLISLNKSYAVHSDAFYNRVLGPAIEFRLNASRKVYPGTSTIAKMAYEAAESTNRNLSLIITDLMRRNDIFTKKMDSIIDNIRIRDKYRKFVSQLSVTGKKVQTTPLEKTEFVLDPDSWFDEIIDTATPTTYRPSHAKLLDVDDVASHPQYLDRFGRNRIEEDIEVKSGVRVGGVLLEGVHDGTEASPKVQGSNVEGLVATSIDRSVVHAPPQNLRIVSTQSSVTGKTVDAHIAWDGDRTHLFDVQITPVSSLNIDYGFAQVYEGSGVTGKFGMALQTYDGQYFYVSYLDPTMIDPAQPDVMSLWRVRQGSGEQKLFNVLDMSTALGVTLEGMGSVLSLGFDWEVASTGDAYFCTPFFSTVPASGLLKYTLATDSFSSMYGSEPVHPELLRVTAGITLNKSTDTFYLSDIEATPTLFESGSGEAYSILSKVKLSAGTSEQVGDPYVGVHIPFFGTDLGPDNIIYGIGGVLGDDGVGVGLMTIDAVTGERGVLSNDGLNSAIISAGGSGVEELFGAPGLGFVTTQNEILVSMGYRIFAISFDGTQSQDVTSSISVSFPNGLCKDKYGRIYTLSLPTNSIYRIFGPQGANVF